jgi:hypothetical protein
MQSPTPTFTDRKPVILSRLASVFAGQEDRFVHALADRGSA